MQEKYGFVYIWRDNKNNRYYIGSHWGTEDDGYICSSRWMRQAHKRRPNDFKRRILSRIYSDRKLLYEKEAEWLSLIKREEMKTRYYNLSLGSTNHWTATDNHLSIREKISKSQIGKKLKPETIEKLKGRRSSPATEFKKGERRSISTEFKVGDASYRKGKTYDELFGTEKASELKQKSSVTQFKPGQSSHNSMKLSTPFGIFNSILQACQSLNIGRKIILKNIKNCDDWYLINKKEI